MRSIKDKLMRKIVDTQPPEGFWYKMETKNEINDTDKMHGIQARSILSFAVFGAYLVGNKQYFDPFLPRLIRWCQTAIELKVESGWAPQDVCLIYEGYAGTTWVCTGQLFSNNP